jgi:hypothetical protein
MSSFHQRLRHETRFPTPTTLVAFVRSWFRSIWLRRCKYYPSLPLVEHEALSTSHLCHAPVTYFFLNSIVVGAVQGQLRSAFSKIGTLHAKNQFTFAIISGDLFAEDDDEVTDLLSGNIVVPLPTYFTVGLNQFPQRVVDKLAKEEEVSS